jgi:hypothetical protein
MAPVGSAMVGFTVVHVVGSLLSPLDLCNAPTTVSHVVKR